MANRPNQGQNQGPVNPSLEAELIRMYRESIENLKKDLATATARIDTERKRGDDANDKTDKFRQELADLKTAHAKELTDLKTAHAKELAATVSRAEKGEADLQKSQAALATETKKVVDLTNKVTKLEHDLRDPGVAETKRTSREAIPKAITGLNYAHTTLWFTIAAAAIATVACLILASSGNPFVGGTLAVVCIAAGALAFIKRGPIETATNILHSLNTSDHGHH